jgi:hypothetical protein
MANNKLQNQSQLDPGGVLKNVHDEQGGALFTNPVKSRIPATYDRVIPTYTNKNLTNIKFYSDTVEEVTKVTTIADSAGSLNNTYFVMYSALDATLYHVWFNVGGAGVDPAPVGSTAIEVTLQTNDNALVVAEAIRLYVGLVADFTTERSGDVTIITNAAKGDTTDTADFNTGFTFSTSQQGVSVLVSDITTQNTDNVFYYWNEFEGKVETQPNLKQSILDGYITHEIDVAGSTTYIGSMDLDGVWLIKRVQETGPDSSIDFANESNNGTYTDFTTAWTNRATLSYDLIENLTGV